MQGKTQAAICHKLFLFTATIVLFLFAACKKQTCDDVTCPADYLCVDGVCRLACDGNPYLVRDSCGVVICGPHQIVVQDTCRCDTNWVGNCDIPIGLVAGKYHVKGSRYTYMGGSGATTTNFEHDITINRNRDTLFFEGYPYKYVPSTDAYFTYEAHVNGPGFRQLRFRRTLDDSVFYKMYEGGMGGGTNSSFSGVKIQ